LEEAFEEEEERLKMDAFINYGKYETFNLENAFGLQLSRVDAEWAVYEQQMVNDYENQKATILGKGRARGGGGGYAEARGNWKSKEKQSRLFNTAPVFSPEGGLGSGSSAHNAELKHLEKVFVRAKERIANQKKNAVRWIKRQEARMKIQVNGTMSDRRVMYPYMMKEADEFKRFIAQVKGVVDKRMVEEAGAKRKAGKDKVGDGAVAEKEVPPFEQHDTDDTEVETSRDLSRSSEQGLLGEDEVERMSKMAIAHKKGKGRKNSSPISRQLFVSN